MVLLFATGVPSVLAGEEGIETDTPEQQYFQVEQEILKDGKTIDRIKIIGPPSPPEGYERPVAPEPDQGDNGPGLPAEPDKRGSEPVPENTRPKGDK